MDCPRALAGKPRSGASMPNAARMARKRASIPFTRKPKPRPVRRHGELLGIGLVTAAEIITAALTRPAR